MRDNTHYLASNIVTGECGASDGTVGATMKKPCSPGAGTVTSFVETGFHFAGSLTTLQNVPSASSRRARIRRHDPCIAHLDDIAVRAGQRLGQDLVRTCQRGRVLNPSTPRLRRKPSSAQASVFSFRFPFPLLLFIGHDRYAARRRSATSGINHRKSPDLIGQETGDRT